MDIIPAIDIKNKKVVRLDQGKFDLVTEYSDSPIEVAKQWESKGAKIIHVVDLDGAKEGELKNSDIVIDIAKAVNIPIETGGGIRTKEDVEMFINSGISRVIMGTVAVENKDFLKELLKDFGEKIAVSVDCLNGMVAQRGWVKTSDIKGSDLAKELEALGLKCIIYTDISRDGMLTGPNFTELEQVLASTNINVIASGGLSSIDDIKKLLGLNNPRLIGAITGKAIYEGKIDLKEALALC